MIELNLVHVLAVLCDFLADLIYLHVLQQKLALDGMSKAIEPLGECLFDHLLLCVPLFIQGFDET